MKKTEGLSSQLFWLHLTQICQLSRIGRENHAITPSLKLSRVSHTIASVKAAHMFFALPYVVYVSFS